MKLAVSCHMFADFAKCSEGEGTKNHGIIDSVLDLLIT